LGKGGRFLALRHSVMPPNRFPHFPVHALREENEAWSLPTFNLLV
jgi:hypothetical protein